MSQTYKPNPSSPWNDINIFDYTVLLLALIAAETAMALSLSITASTLLLVAAPTSLIMLVLSALNPSPAVRLTGYSIYK